jgi:hypothetical protein
MYLDWRLGAAANSIRITHPKAYSDFPEPTTRGPGNELAPTSFPILPTVGVQMILCKSLEFRCPQSLSIPEDTLIRWPEQY